MSTAVRSVLVEAPPPVNTYAYLWIRFKGHLTDAGKKSGDIRPYRTALNEFMRANSLTDTSVIGEEFGAEFDQKLLDFSHSQKEARVRPSTYQPRVSRLKQLKKFYVSISEVIPVATELPVPTDFSGRLRRRIADLGYTHWQFYDRVARGVISSTTLHSWVNGLWVPASKSISKIKKLEKLLGVEEGDLVNCLPKYLQGRRGRQTGLTAYGKRIQKVTRKPYFVWTDAVEEEWQPFVAYKSAPIPKSGERRGRHAVWTSTVGAKLPTAGRMKSNLRLVFGYCCLPTDHEDPLFRGRGMRPNEMSLSLLANVDVVEGFVEFQRRRSGDQYNGGTLTFLASVASILHPDYGYLPQHPEIPQRSNPSLTDEAWRERCHNAHKRISRLHSDIVYLKESESESFGKGRDPQEPLAKILALDRPLIPVLEAVKTMLRELPPETSGAILRAVHYRDTLLMALMAANPLRIRQFSIMEFDKHLFRRENGSWWLQFERREFKNRRSIRSDYCVRVAPRVWPLIERYRKEFRPLLAGADACQYVFRPQPGRGSLEGGEKISAYDTRPMSTHAIRRAIVFSTYRYIPGCPGFSPHGFRHIVATDIIKRDRKFGFFLASKALHDKLETVEKEYQHLKVYEFFEPYNDLFIERWDEVMGDDESGGEA